MLIDLISPLLKLNNSVISYSNVQYFLLPLRHKCKLKFPESKMFSKPIPSISQYLASMWDSTSWHYELFCPYVSKYRTSFQNRQMESTEQNFGGELPGLWTYLCEHWRNDWGNS